METSTSCVFYFSGTTPLASVSADALTKYPNWNPGSIDPSIIGGVFPSKVMNPPRGEPPTNPPDNKSEVNILFAPESRGTRCCWLRSTPSGYQTPTCAKCTSAGPVLGWGTSHAEVGFWPIFWIPVPKGGVIGVGGSTVVPPFTVGVCPVESPRGRLRLFAIDKTDIIQVHGR